jgi:hypothetical protein
LPTCMDLGEIAIFGFLTTEVEYVLWSHSRGAYEAS